jgi:hypothetical protein
MSVHFKNVCHRVQDIICLVPSETKWNEDTQPHLVMQGFASNVEVTNNIAYIY